MFRFLSTFIQEDASLGGDYYLDIHPDDLDPNIYPVSGGTGIGIGMTTIILLLIAIFVLILIVRRVGKSSSSKKDNSHKPVDSYKQGDKTPQYSTFYVADDGTIVRGQKDTVGTGSPTVVIESQSEQKEALLLIKESADAGVAEAQYYLGLCYEQGTVVSKDLEEAKKWYRLAASQSYPQAKFRLGKLMMEDKQ